MFKSFIAALAPATILAYGTGDGSSYENAAERSGIDNGTTKAKTWLRWWLDFGEDGATPTFHGESSLYLPHVSIRTRDYI